MQELRGADDDLAANEQPYFQASLMGQNDHERN